MNLVKNERDELLIKQQEVNSINSKLKAEIEYLKKSNNDYKKKLLI